MSIDSVTVVLLHRSYARATFASSTTVSGAAFLIFLSLSAIFFLDIVVGVRSFFGEVFLRFFFLLEDLLLSLAPD